MQRIQSKSGRLDPNIAASLRLFSIIYAVGLQLSVYGKLHSSLSHNQHCLYPCFASTISTSATITRQRNLHRVAAPESNEFIATSNSSTQTQVPELYSVDVRYNSKSPLTYDPTTGRYLDDTSTEIQAINNEEINIITRFLQSAFVPEGVTPSYYTFMRWRILQRFVNANVHVIGTQSLLMGLRGMHKSTAGVGAVATGAAAATNWVLKDTLGKIVRMGT